MHAPVVAILGLLLARALACTNVLVTPGASADGSAMLTYNADSSSMMGQMHFARHAAWPANATIDVYEWDTGKYLGKIPQVAETYNVVGNMNEYQLAITETTFGGLEQLATQSKALIDYGSLIYITLERAKTAREAISVMANLVATYGYYSEGESFSIADPHEVWIMEMIGKGEFELGAVWVAVRIPDGYISSHANQARIRQFPLNDPERAVYSPDVISFAKAHGFYPREAADSEFSFSDTYHPVTYTMARACEGRVWSVFRRFCGAAAVERYTDYVLGANLTNRMPLWVLPARKLTVNDTMMVMRDHYEGTVMDFTQDVGAGAYGAPYRWTLMFNYGGHMYQHERAIGVPQTGFAIVTQSRAWLPREIGSLIWFGVDDASTTVYFPAYVSATKCALASMAGVVISVSLPFGTVRGLGTSTGNFYNDIPYAMPPTEPWRGPFAGGAIDGTRLSGIACPQMDWKHHAVGSEDCLTLNIFTPTGSPRGDGEGVKGDGALLPVLFWIHGGGWVAGAATDRSTDGRRLATYTGAVVVSANHRLGPLGFLALSELARESATMTSGNYGVHDLIEALRWVHAHVGAFGGDKDRVAVFGESSGAGLAMALLSLPSTQGLFRAVIAQSTPGIDMRLQRQESNSRVLAVEVGCNDSASLLECMRSKSTEELLRHSGRFFVGWAQTVDGVFLNGTIESSLASGIFNRVPLLVGSNANDGALFAFMHIRGAVPRSSYAREMAKLLPETVLSSTSLLSRATALYPAVDDDDNTGALIELETDKRAFCPARRFARAASRWVDTYGYIWWGMAPCTNRAVVSNHADEIDYIWQNNGACVLNETALEFGRSVGRYWASMAAHGNPSEGRAAGTPAWRVTNGSTWQALRTPGITVVPTARADSLLDLSRMNIVF
eukprot:m51a1_g8487 hypothetical protein (898) ;mRNA; r:537898-549315